MCSDIPGIGNDFEPSSKEYHAASSMKIRIQHCRSVKRMHFMNCAKLLSDDDRKSSEIVKHLPYPYLCSTYGDAA